MLVSTSGGVQSGFSTISIERNLWLVFHLSILALALIENVDSKCGFHSIQSNAVLVSRVNWLCAKLCIVGLDALNRCGLRHWGNLNSAQA